MDGARASCHGPSIRSGPRDLRQLCRDWLRRRFVSISTAMSDSDRFSSPLEAILIQSCTTAKTARVKLLPTDFPGRQASRLTIGGARLFANQACLLAVPSEEGAS